MPRSYVEKYQGIFNGNIASTSTGTGTLVVTGGIGTSGRVSANDVIISATTASTSTSTGALTISGGVGVSGDINVGGNIEVGNISATSVSANSLATENLSIYNSDIWDGGAGNINLGPSTGYAVRIVPGASLGGTESMTGLTPTASTSTSTGALIVSGGVGISGNLNVGGSFSVGTLSSTDLTVAGNLIVNGTTTTINSTTMTVDDNNIELGSVDTPTDTTANGGGITLRGATNKTISWTSTGNNWTSSENFSLVSGKVYKINNTQVLSSTQLGSAITFNSNTASTSTDTGTLVVTGGVGVSGSINARGPGIGGYMDGATWYGPDSGITAEPAMKLGSIGNIGGYGGGLTNAASASTSTDTGTLVVEGGVGISGCLNIGGYITRTVIGGYAYGNTSFGVGQPSNSTDTGTLVVTGGVGVSGRVSADNVQAVAIQATAIGNVAAGTGAFTTLSSSGATTMTQGTASTSTGTGTLVVTGGVGVSGTVSAGGLSVPSINSTPIGNATASSGAFTTLSSNGATTMTAATASTSTDTGTLVVTGGVGVSGTVSAGGLSVPSINSTPIGNATASSGAFTTLSSNGATTMTAATASTSTDTGTLVVTGGVGVSDKVYIGGGVDSNAAGSGGTLVVSGGSSISGESYFGSDVTINGALRVNGTTTTINSTTLTVDDKNIELGSVPNFTNKSCVWDPVEPTKLTFPEGTSLGVAQGIIPGCTFEGFISGASGVTTPSGTYVVSIDKSVSDIISITLNQSLTGSTIYTGGCIFGGVSDVTANGGGITLRGATNKTINWTSTGNNWTSSENFDLVSTKVYKINNTQVLSSTQLGSAITFNSNTASTSTSTGTLVVTGGVGVSGVIHCNGIKTNKLNPGVTLIEGATPSPKVSIKFPVNFKNVAENSMFTVPTDCMFLIDSMEIITTTITSPGTAPTVRLGNTSTANAYYGPTLVTSNSVGARHIIENPQDGVVAGTTVTCGVTSASTATTHSGFIKVTGELINLSDTPTTVAGGAYSDF